MSDFRTNAHSRVPAAVTVLLAGTILVGCAGPIGGPGVSRYEPTYLNLTNEHAFSQALRRHYLELATNAYDRGDLDRSDFYSLRALMAAEGKLAEPGGTAPYDGVGGDAAAAGERLSMLLMSGVRTGSPDLAGRAQAAYDCWLVESGGGGDPQIAQSCRYNALNAIAQLDGASTGEQIVATAAPTAQQGQTYVIENGTPSQVIQTNGGITIQVITQHGGYVPDHYVQERVPATYSTVPHAQPNYAAAPAPVPMIETMPMIEEQVASMGSATPNYAITDHGFDAVPVLSADDAEMVEYAETEFAPMTDLAAEMPGVPPHSIDLGPIESYPVFGTKAVATMPSVEMAALPMTHGADAASALIDATANMTGDFAIFFGFDSDEVTIEAEDVLIDAVERIRISGAKRVALMGYTDSVGDARYNQLLAMRRAQAVRQYLQKSLGTSVSFEILPVGEVHAVRNGGDGVKEALNRKVEISLK